MNNEYPYKEPVKKCCENCKGFFGCWMPSHWMCGDTFIEDHSSSIYAKECIKNDYISFSPKIIKEETKRGCYIEIILLIIFIVGLILFM
jgi:hypothetical protein